MKVYHVETQQAYDELMIELEEKGYRWLSGYKPTEFDYWERNKEDSCINISSKYITFMNIEQSKKQHPDTPVIEYKSKGENMTQEEMKQNILDWATDVSIAAESFSRNIKFKMKKATAEADLKEAKSSAKKLIEKIDKYLESLKPEFKVGDYVVDDSSYLTMKVDGASNSVVDSAICYNFRYFTVRNNLVCETGYLRHATPEEIAEYESALNFHEHGRKPFEVRIGDLIRNKSDGKNFLVKGDTIFLRKQDFIDGKLFFLKTYKEVNEWLENK